MGAERKSGVEIAEAFLRHAIEAKKFRDELESFGTDEIKKVVDIAKTLGYEFGPEDLKAALEKNWERDSIYVNKFCISEPPGI